MSLQLVLERVIAVRALEIREAGSNEIELAMTELQQAAACLDPIEVKPRIPISHRMRLVVGGSDPVPPGILLRRMDRALLADHERASTSGDISRVEMIERRRVSLARQVNELDAMAKVAPSDVRRGGVLIRSTVGDLDKVGLSASGRDAFRPALSVTDGTLARPIWSIDISADLKGIAAAYAAAVDLMNSGSVGGLDLSAIRVDGGGARRSDPMIGALDAKRRVEAARRGLMRMIGMRPQRRRAGDKRKRISARRMVDDIAIKQLTICEILRAHGWDQHAKNKDLARDLIERALDKIAPNFRI